MFLKRVTGRHAEPTPPPPGPAAALPEAPPAVLGDQQCSERGCPRQDAAPCSYRDRHQAQCGSPWCPDHHVAIAGQAYCRRHAAIARALNRVNPPPGTPPDMDNRAPSLCEWVGNEIDEAVRAALDDLRGAEPVDIVVDPLTLTMTGTPRQRVWERNWKLVSPAGTWLRVNLLVTEEADSQVVLKVDSRVAFEQVPPWILARADGRAVDPDQDVAERRAFNAELVQSVRHQVATHGLHPPF